MSKKDKKKSEPGRKILATNRRARYEYHLLESFEAGLMLRGSEVKSLREGRCSLSDSYATVRGGEVWLQNFYVAPWEKAASAWQPAERRERKLLLNKGEIRKIIGAVSRKGLTVVPTRVYFNERNRAKVEIAIAQGKKVYDKRHAIKERDQKRDSEREFRKR